MGELRGRGDQPSERPDKPADADPPWNSTRDGSKFWRVVRASDAMFAPPGESRSDRSRLEYEKPRPDDRPAERPPSGEELVEKDAPEASRADKFRKRLMDKDTLEEITDRVDSISEFGARFFGSRPPTKAEVCVRQPEHWQAPQHASDGGQLASGMLVVGFMIGHGTMWAHRKWSERKSQA